jgi:hypothetical protein
VHHYLHNGSIRRKRGRERRKEDYENILAVNLTNVLKSSNRQESRKLGEIQVG